MSDLREAQERGFIAKTPHFNSIFNCFDNTDVREILTDMIEVTALPLKALEDSFVVDSSGFGVSRFFRWYDHKYGVEKDRRDWVKIQVMVGTRTNIVTAVEIRPRCCRRTDAAPFASNDTQELCDLRSISLIGAGSKPAAALRKLSAFGISVLSLRRDRVIRPVETPIRGDHRLPFAPNPA
jgi:hypothetical protein